MLGNSIPISGNPARRFLPHDEEGDKEDRQKGS